jgi:hypothetical protein
MGVEVIKHRSAVPGFASVAFGSNSAPAWWRFSFWVPKERAFLCMRVSVTYDSGERGSILNRRIYMVEKGRWRNFVTSYTNK